MDYGGFFNRHPVFSNIIIIFIIAFIGLWIAYLSLKIFTNHGAFETLPSVENMSYTQAVNVLHEDGFRVDIRDSVYNEDVKPGYVIEQFPKAGSSVKPGRKIFLYINAVHPREMIIDSDKGIGEALKGYSMRQGMAKLEELGFRHVKVVKVIGDNDRIIKLTANGKTVMKMDKIPVTAEIVMEVYDNSLNAVNDSIQNEEYLQSLAEGEYEDDGYYDNSSSGHSYDEDPEPAFVQ